MRKGPGGGKLPRPFRLWAGQILLASKSSRGRKRVRPRNLTLIGGEKSQLRQPSKRDWTKVKEREFLTALSETCNVTRASAEAGVSTGHAYARRKTNAAFRAGWAEAIGAAYQRLELMLLDRSLNGTEKIVRRKDGSEERMLEYSNQTALTLLKMHRDTAAEADVETPPERVEEIRERLIQKLQRLKKRHEEEDQGE